MSWSQLVAIKKDAVRMRQEDDRVPLVACPICGVPLVTNQAGVKNCPAGDFRQ